MTYYKWLNPGRVSTIQNVKWPKRVNAWTDDETPVLCTSGWHLATDEGLGEFAVIGATLWIAEGRGNSVSESSKVAFTSVRLLSEVGIFTHEIAVHWAADCAKRVLKHYEDRYPSDDRPRRAIEAAMKWSKNPTEANRAAAAAFAASAAASHAASAHAVATHAASKEREWQSARLIKLIQS